MRTHQQSLLSLLEVPNKIFGLSKALVESRTLMNGVAKEYEPGRDILVDRINEIAEQEDFAISNSGSQRISKDILDKWLQPGAKKHGPNLNGVICFCLATRDFSPLQPFFDALGLIVIREEEMKFLRVGKAKVKYDKAKEEMKKAEAPFK